MNSQFSSILLKFIPTHQIIEFPPLFEQIRLLPFLFHFDILKNHQTNESTHRDIFQSSNDYIWKEDGIASFSVYSKIAKPLINKRKIIIIFIRSKWWALKAAPLNFYRTEPWLPDPNYNFEYPPCWTAFV